MAHSPNLPSLASHPFFQAGVSPVPTPDGSIKNRPTLYNPKQRAYSDHHVSLYTPSVKGNPPLASRPTVDGTGTVSGRPPSIISNGTVSRPSLRSPSGNASTHTGTTNTAAAAAAAAALSARQRPPSAPPRSVRGPTGERIVGGIQRTPISELTVTPAMEVAAAAAPLVAPVRKAREITLHVNDAGNPFMIASEKPMAHGPRVGAIVRLPRDSTWGDICQFASTLPPELENRVSAAAFTFFVQAINIHLRDASSVSGVVVDNVIAFATLGTSLCWRTTHFETELRRAEVAIDSANRQTFNPKGISVASPRRTDFQYLEIEY